MIPPLGFLYSLTAYQSNGKITWLICSQTTVLQLRLIKVYFLMYRLFQSCVIVKKI